MARVGRHGRPADRELHAPRRCGARRRPRRAPRRCPVNTYTAPSSQRLAPAALRSVSPLRLRRDRSPPPLGDAVRPRVDEDVGTDPAHLVHLQPGDVRDRSHARVGERRGPAPSSAGARYASTRSTRPAATNAPASRGPPSSSTSTTPRAERGEHRVRVVRAQVQHVRCVQREPARDVAGARPPPAAGCARAASRRGWRAVSGGSSASTVPVPTTIASTAARSSCTSARARAGDPAAGAVRGGAAPVQGGRELPGDVRPAGAHGVQPGPQRAAGDLLGEQPSRTATPAARSTAAPPPAPGDAGRAPRRRPSPRPPRPAPRCTAGCGRGARRARG